MVYKLIKQEYAIIIYINAVAMVMFVNGTLQNGVQQVKIDLFLKNFSILIQLLFFLLKVQEVLKDVIMKITQTVLKGTLGLMVVKAK